MVTKPEDLVLTPEEAKEQELELTPVEEPAAPRDYDGEDLSPLGLLTKAILDQNSFLEKIEGHLDAVATSMDEMKNAMEMK